MSNINASIKLGSGFLLKNAPVDLKTTAASITERDSYVTAGVLYKGATVYVEENDTRYRYTGEQPSDGDFSPCWVVDTPAGDVSESVKDQIDSAIEEQVTNKIGDTIQAHSPVLDQVAKLDAEGLAYRKADGTFTEMTVSGQDGVQVTVTPDSGTIVAELTDVGTAGTYTKVTTDAQGRVTAGENPTTLDGYGITDAVKKSGDTMSGLLKYAATVTEDQFDDQTLVPKYYADSVALGYATHEACETGSAENIDGVYADGTSVPDSPGVGATFTLSADTGNTTAINGVTLTTGMRVLLVGQTDGKQNGAYVVTNVPEAATGNVVMERVDDLDGEPHVTYDGASFLIAQGTLKGTVWKLANRGEITFGTDEINFNQAFAPTQYIAGDGISVEANTISVKQGGTVKVIGGNLEVTSGTGNTGKFLRAGADGTVPTWETVETDFQTIAPAGVKGDILYHNGTQWVALNKGAANTILGVGADGELAYLTKIEQGTF